MKQEVKSFKIKLLLVEYCTFPVMYKYIRSFVSVLSLFRSPKAAGFKVGHEIQIGLQLSRKTFHTCRYVTHHSVHKPVKVLHSDLLEEVHVGKDIGWP